MNRTKCHSPTGARDASPLLGYSGIVTACSSLLDVKNPNNVNAEDLNNPKAAPAIANGALATVAYGWGAILLEYSTASDEMTWIGSRDGFRELDVGNMTNPTNEFTDAAFPFVGRARWMSDFAIKQLSGFRFGGNVEEPRRPRARLPVCRDRVHDDRRHVQQLPHRLRPPHCCTATGPDEDGFHLYNCHRLHDAGLAITQRPRTEVCQLALTAQRARAEHAKAVWAKLHPAARSAPWWKRDRHDPAANTDAAAALALATVDWKYRFAYSSTTTDNYMGAWVNSRQEMRVGDAYIRASTKDTLKDPIQTSSIQSCDALRSSSRGRRQPSSTGRSPWCRSRALPHSRGAALAAGDTLTVTGQFAASINAVRTLNALPAYDPANAAHPRPSLC